MHIYILTFFLYVYLCYSFVYNHFQTGRLHFAHEEMENKQKNAKFWVKTHELSLLSHIMHLYHNVCKQRLLISDFSSIVLSFSKWFVDFWMAFCKNSIKISCRIILVNKPWTSPFQVLYITDTYLMAALYDIDEFNASGTHRESVVMILFCWLEEGIIEIWLWLMSANEESSKYWTKKERYHFGDVTFLSSRWKWIYGIWNIVNSHIPHRVMS